MTAKRGVCVEPGDAQWYNPTAFAVPAVYICGSAGRNIMRGYNVSNLDFSVAKHFRVTNGSNLEFRAEMSNTANHANFGYPDSTITDGSGAGQISYTVSANREIQLALRYAF